MISCSCFRGRVQTILITEVFPQQNITLLAVVLFSLSHSCFPLHISTENLFGWSSETPKSMPSNEKPEEFHINMNECANTSILQSSTLKGVIYGQSGEQNHSRSVPACTWSVEVPAGYVVSSYVLVFMDPCLITVTVTALSSSPTCSDVDYRCTDVRGRKVMAVSDLNRQTFSFKDSLKNASLTLEFQVYFEAVKKSELYSLPVVLTSPTSGYVTSHGYDDGKQYPCGYNATQEITAPEGHVAMISFSEKLLEILDVLDYSATNEKNLYKIDERGSLVLVDTVYALRKGPTIVENKVLLHIKEEKNDGLGSKMLFTFHPSSHAPRRLDSRLWDCSGPHYSTFKDHLECNLEQECQGGEDEGPHCPYSSPACNGSVAVGSKCYMYMEQSKDAECRQLGGNLASMKSKEEWEAFSQLFKYGKNHGEALIGLKTSSTVWPKYYRYVFQWADNTIAYEANTTQGYLLDFTRKICGFYYLRYSLHTLLMECFACREYTSLLVCEYDAHLEETTKQVSVRVSEISTVWNNMKVRITFCPSGHVTHSFLSCDPKSACGTRGLPLYCRTTAGVDTSVEMQMFSCDDHLTTLPYILVCDFRNDCLDASDETFCKHEDSCREFRCRNGQCVAYSNFCDSYTDCWDGSDEDCAYTYFYKYPNNIRLFPPAVVYFDGQGDFYQVSLEPSERCPQTHFRCAGESAYCLPVYVRCNGVYDCPSHEDEEDCQLYTCPGFYRCRQSTVCVHADNMCDGWPQCPQHDDEKFCELRCPDECICQGLAVVCKKPFSTFDFPNVRYLDGANSGMTMKNISSNTYLVWVSLAFCGLDSVTSVYLPNLQTLDLRNNHLTTIDLGSFTLLINLKELRLAGNPLVNLLNSGFPYLHKNLQIVDIAHTSLMIFDSRTFLNFTNIQVLNVSFNQVQTITDNGFIYLPQLSTLDISHNPLEIFPRETLRSARRLRAVYADNYKLCCQKNLPDSFETGSCFAPVDEISSCEDLLRSDVYRVFLWLFCVLSVTGNAGSFLFRQTLQRKASTSGFGVFVTNLSMADFLMGVYLAMLGVADETYRSIYLWHDVQWRVSTTCKVAGFLSFMSSEVSTLIICLITLDRFIILRFPFTKFRFKRRSAWWTCGLAWCVGFVLSAVPLLPFLSDWEFYSHNAICMPLPMTRKGFGGRSYSFGIMIIFNMILFMVIAVGQACIYRSVLVNSMKGNTTRKSKDIIIARRLATVVVSDFLCWFPVGMVSIMASLGVPIPSEASVAMVIFVLPLNSALNPFLYTLNLLLEKINRAEEKRVLKNLVSGVDNKGGDGASLSIAKISPPPAIYVKSSV